MNPKTGHNLVIASAVFAALTAAYMSTSMNSGEWIRSKGVTKHTHHIEGQGINSQGLWNKCSSAKAGGSIAESYACCSNIQAKDFKDVDEWHKLETVQALAVLSSVSIGLGTILLFVVLGTKHHGVKIASTVFIALGVLLAIASLVLYANYTRNIDVPHMEYVMGWGQSIFITATIFSVVSLVLISVSFQDQSEE